MRFWGLWWLRLNSHQPVKEGPCTPHRPGALVTTATRFDFTPSKGIALG